MKRFVKIFISAVMTIFMAGVLFFNMVGGAPVDPAAANSYIIKAALFSVLASGLGCACIHYILYLQKQLEEKEKESRQQ